MNLLLLLFNKGTKVLRSTFLYKIKMTAFEIKQMVFNQNSQMTCIMSVYSSKQQT